ncbi:S8 family serine peptidase [Shewanella sp. WXL01]|uniref:GlyGly-CTERM sorting domain-containing protein n=2 Tax=Shewanellaceae TaxID=267890 RepID=A0A411PMU3_9GAMM|nr:S8 family serine peptidase [Shewanella sp. WXL01]QBF84835.1 GlyGly-CTERM sorting domain-containing protein [Shewanella maritima]
MRVAVIDGGIRPENPMFGDEGFEAPTGDLPTDDYCATVDATFCNNKLIVARWSQPTFPVCADEYMSPLGFGGHGTHVAGTAVGNRVDITYRGNDVTIAGVAPAAYLMSYKALYTNTACERGSGSNIMLMEALEHAANDGADVINNSWGGGAGADPASSPYKSMFEAAEAAGIVVVSAAGNDGNGAKTIGCPACIESGISVANSTHGRFFANSFNAGGDDLLAIPGSDTVIDMDVSAPIIAARNLDAENFEGCEPFATDSFKDGIALISRGACAFSTKAENAMNAGAKALVVYNSNPGAPIIMSMPGVTFPSVMISNADGLAVEASLGESEEAITGVVGSEVKRIVDTLLADTINASSSRGPNGNENILKPDLAAPGTNILSAYSPDDGGAGLDYAAISGTSMASPHVAGAAALLAQMHPDWSANDIKTALTSTSKLDGILDDDAQTPASPFATGAGRMDLDAAAKAVLTFDKPSVASDSCVGMCTFTRTVYNKSEEATSWSLSAKSDAAGITVMPSTLDLEPGASAEITVMVDSTFSTYGEWIFGNIMLTSASHQDAHLPLAVLAQESSDSSLISTFTPDTDITTEDSFEVVSVLNNTRFENTVTFTAKLPEGTELTSADDVTVAVTNGVQNGFSVNESTGTLTWVGNLELPEMVAQKGTGSYPNILGLGLGYTPPCADGCDETSFTFNLPAFKYNGQEYTQLTMSDNGLVIPGGGTTSGTYANKELPDSGNPNNIVAPFWADFDLSDGTAGDTGGGTVSIDIVGTATDSWVVVEWNDAQLWNDPSGDQYSFSVWFKTGETEEVTFNYFKVPNMPSNVTIGAENIGGTIGTTFHYNGNGDTVAPDDFVSIGSSSAGQVQLSYMAKGTTFALLDSDNVTVEEDSEVELNVRENDKDMEQKVARTQVTADGITAKAQRLIDVLASGDVTNVAIVDQPANGTATLSSEGVLKYVPNADFFGKDMLTYTAEDAAGTKSEPTTVYLTVTNVNDAPTVSVADKNAVAALPVTLSASGSDADNDDLTYTWTQTSGSSVSFTNGGSSISFTAPAEVGKLTFTVTANDGTVSSAEATATVDVEAQYDEGGSSLGWLTALLLPVAALRRRNRKH